MDIKLILPNKKHKEQVEKFKEEMLKAGSTMDGTGSLRNDDFETWLKRSNDHRHGKNLLKDHVPATQYLVIRKQDNKLVGMVQIRHELNDLLLNFGGHIGGCVAPSERGKGYGRDQLTLCLKKCKKLGIKKVMVSCKDTNALSRKCLIANGGVYEDTRTMTKETNGKKEIVNLERYWIDLTK